jgi:hypothetical protein
MANATTITVLDSASATQTVITLDQFVTGTGTLRASASQSGTFTSVISGTAVVSGTTVVTGSVFAAQSGSWTAIISGTSVISGTAVVTGSVFAAQSGSFTVSPLAGVTWTTVPVAGTVWTAVISGTAVVTGNLQAAQSGTWTATQGGTWTVQPGNTPNTTGWLVNAVGPWDKGSGSGGTATQRMIIDSSQLSNLGLASPGTSVPVVQAAFVYQTAAANTTTTFGTSGSTGDYLAGILIVPGNTSPGTVTMLDNTSSFVIFAGGTTSVSNQVPFMVPLGAFSQHGAWKVSTGSSVTAVGLGKFT